MSRLTLIASLLLGLSSVATASESRFAQPPASDARASVSAADVWAPPVSTQLRIAPRRLPDRATVRAALAKARATNLAAFRVYQNKGVFPNNTFERDKLNVWLDEDGNFCAAATIIKLSGMDDLVTKVAEQNNFIRLADVKQGPLMNWILTSGLTQAEIAAIQEPFMPVMRTPVEPQQPILVDTKLRDGEDARLRAKYRTVDRMIVKNTKTSLDAATDRLMKFPSLARQLVDSLEG
ncbi:MAG TPA: hypothetical protein VIV11_08470 [Kofleriaceae bacterium]